MSSFNCPHCGRQISVSKGSPYQPVASISTTGWMADQVRASWLPESANTPAPAGVTPGVQFTHAKRTTPARAASVDSDVMVPLFQALTSGIVTGLASLGIVAWLEWPVYLVPLGGGVTFCVAWFVLLVDHRKLLRIVEEIINKDIDKDGKVGQEWRVKGEHKATGDDEHEHWDLYNLPCPSPGYLQAYARDLLTGAAAFSELGAGKYAYSRAMWLELRDIFLDRGWALWKHPTEERQGVRLISYGKVILRDIVESELP